MSTTSTVNTKVVAHIAKLANLTLQDDKLEEATKQFGSVLGYISNIQKVNTDDIVDISPSSSATDFSREDVVDESRTLTQAEALSNAPQQHNGYFVVNSILSE